MKIFSLTIDWFQIKLPFYHSNNMGWFVGVFVFKKNGCVHEFLVRSGYPGSNPAA